MEEKIVSYIRCSTKNQDVSAQKSKIEEYAKEKNYQISKFFIDEGISGTVEDRPALLELEEWIRENRGGKIIFLNIDRAARDLHLYTKIERMCSDNLVVTEYVGFSSTGNASTDTLLKNVLASFASYEKDIIKSRMYSGKAFLLQNGAIVSGGQAPYGYTFEKIDFTYPSGKVIKVRQLIENPEESKIVKEIYEMFSKGKAVYAIANHLDNNKIPTSRRGRTRTGVNWAVSSLNHILRNETYIGNFVYGKSETIKVKGKSKEITRLKDEGKISIKVPAIISKKLFSDVQKRIKKQKITWQRITENKSKFALKGKLKCGICGHNYCGSAFKGKDYAYYRCTSFNHVKDEKGKRGCGNKTVIAEDIEGNVQRNLVNLLINPNKINRVIDQMISQLKIDYKSKDEKIDELNKKLKRYDSQMLQLNHGYLIGNYTDEEMKKLKTELKEKTTLTIREIARFNSALDEVEKLQGSKKYLSLITRDLDKHLERLKTINPGNLKGIREIIYPLKKELFDKYIDYVEIFPNKLVINYSVPFFDKTIVTRNNSPQAPAVSPPYF